MSPPRDGGRADASRRVKVVRISPEILNDESYQRIDAVLAAWPWQPFRIDFKAVEAVKLPWPRDPDVQELLSDSWVSTITEVVVILTIGTPDQPRGWILPSDSLATELEEREVVDAIILPVVHLDGASWVLTSPAMWVEVGSNIWIWGDADLDHLD